MTERIDLRAQLDNVEDEWLDDDDSWEDGLEPEQVEEPARPTRSRDRERNRRREEREEAPRKGLFGKKSKDAEASEETTRKSRRERDRKAEPAERPAAAPAQQTSALTDLVLLLFKIGLVVIFLLILFTFFFGITQARDESMTPAVKEGDLVIYYRPDKDYMSGDAIVVEYNGSMQVRRVVAVAGDTVDISSEGGLIINGSTQIESDIYTTTYPYTSGITFPVTVGEGEVFVLGDDRTDAEDSRVYGCVSTSATKGAVFTIIRRRGI